MTPQQVERVQASFAKLAPIADRAALAFYQRLFETAPEVKALFPNAMEAQRQKLVAALAMVVDSLGDIDAIAPAIAELATRHVAYGVRPEHYDAVGAALLWALEQGLGSDFNPAAREAWTQAYSALSTMMVAAAYGDGTGQERRP
jgi:nitric oxide dioxygenase